MQKKAARATFHPVIGRQEARLSYDIDRTTIKGVRYDLHGAAGATTTTRTRNSTCSIKGAQTTSPTSAEGKLCQSGPAASI